MEGDCTGGPSRNPVGERCLRPSRAARYHARPMASEDVGRRRRVAIDGTPFLGQRTGIGHLTAQLVSALAQADDVDVCVYSISRTGRRDLAPLVPPTVRIGGVAPAGALCVPLVGARLGSADRAVDRRRRRRPRDQLPTTARPRSGARVDPRHDLRPPSRARRRGEPPLRHSSGRARGGAGRLSARDQRLRRRRGARLLRPRARPGDARVPRHRRHGRRRRRRRTSPCGSRRVRPRAGSDRAAQELSATRAGIRQDRRRAPRTWRSCSPGPTGGTSPRSSRLAAGTLRRARAPARIRQRRRAPRPPRGRDRRSHTHRSTRGSGSRRSRRCRRASRWSPGAEARCPRSSAMPRSSSSPKTSMRSQRRSSHSSGTRQFAGGWSTPASQRAASLHVGAGRSRAHRRVPPAESGRLTAIPNDVDTESKSCSLR